MESRPIQDNTMQAAYVLQKAIDRLGKSVRPTGAEIPSSAIDGDSTVDEALSDLDERVNTAQSQIDEEVSAREAADNTQTQAIASVRSLASAGSFSTFAQLSDIMDEQASATAQGTAHTFTVACSGSVSMFIANLVYSVHMYRPGSTTYLSAIIYANTNKTVVFAYRGQAGWTYRALAFAEDVENSWKRLDVTNGSTVKFNLGSSSGLYASCFIVLVGYNTTAQGIAILMRNNTNLVKTILGTPSAIDISMTNTSTGEISITNSAGSTIYALVRGITGQITFN